MKKGLKKESKILMWVIIGIVILIIIFSGVNYVFNTSQADGVFKGALRSGTFISICVTECVEACEDRLDELSDDPLEDPDCEDACEDACDDGEDSEERDDCDSDSKSDSESESDSESDDCWDLCDDCWDNYDDCYDDCVWGWRWDGGLGYYSGCLNTGGDKCTTSCDEKLYACAKLVDSFRDYSCNNTFSYENDSVYGESGTYGIGPSNPFGGHWSAGASSGVSTPAECRSDCNYDCFGKDSEDECKELCDNKWPFNVTNM